MEAVYGQSVSGPFSLQHPWMKDLRYCTAEPFHFTYSCCYKSIFVFLSIYIPLCLSCSYLFPFPLSYPLYFQLPMLHSLFVIYSSFSVSLALLSISLVLSIFLFSSVHFFICVDSPCYPPRMFHHLESASLPVCATILTVVPEHSLAGLLLSDSIFGFTRSNPSSKPQH